VRLPRTAEPPRQRRPPKCGEVVGLGRGVAVPQLHRLAKLFRKPLYESRFRAVRGRGDRVEAAHRISGGAAVRPIGFGDRRQHVGRGRQHPRPDVAVGRPRGDRGHRGRDPLGQAVPRAVGQRAPTGLRLGQRERFAQPDQGFGVDVPTRVLGKGAYVGGQRAVRPRQPLALYPPAALRPDGDERGLHQTARHGEPGGSGGARPRRFGRRQGHQQRTRRRGDEPRVGADGPCQSRRETPHTHDHGEHDVIRREGRCQQHRNAHHRRHADHQRYPAARAVGQCDGARYRRGSRGGGRSGSAAPVHPGSGHQQDAEQAATDATHVGHRRPHRQALQHQAILTLRVHASGD
jgi:hypothetical protein